MFGLIYLCFSLPVPDSKGSVVTLCNKKYFFSKEKVLFWSLQLNLFILILSQLVFEAAAKACCDLGMTLSSVETKAEQDCIYDHNKSTILLSVLNFVCWCILLRRYEAEGWILALSHLKILWKKVDLVHRIRSLDQFRFSQLDPYEPPLCGWRVLLDPKFWFWGHERRHWGRDLHGPKFVHLRGSII